MLLVDPLLQVYVVAPFAINVAVKPVQIVEELTVTVGIGVTDTLETAVFVHPLVVPITVKLVFEQEIQLKDLLWNLCSKRK